MPKQSKQPIIIEEFIPAAGSDKEPWRKEDAGTTGPAARSFVANSRQMASSMAASKALSEGKSKEEALEAARQAWSSAVEPPPADVPTPEDELKVRWLKAICRLGSGNFDGCSPRDLMDVAMLVDKPVLPYEAWSQAARET